MRITNALQRPLTLLNRACLGKLPCPLERSLRPGISNWLPGRSAPFEVVSLSTFTTNTHWPAVLSDCRESSPLTLTALFGATQEHATGFLTCPLHTCLLRVPGRAHTPAMPHLPASGVRQDGWCEPLHRRVSAMTTKALENVGAMACSTAGCPWELRHRVDSTHRPGPGPGTYVQAHARMMHRFSGS